MMVLSRERSATAPIGWPLLPVPDEHGRLRHPSLYDSIEERIRIILMTRPGELLGHHAFGVGLPDVTHQPNTLLTHRRVHDAIRGQLARYEPRIRVDRIDVRPDAAAPDRLHIAIHYRLRQGQVSHSTQVVLQLGD